ncbi:UPF0481 protein At3g47200-like [Mangifera indica]|uniref:UPF0481 protein At3g47200-like n=1 Tax=Mangifera indica TaxID=29780 RepID=UPI001CFA792E|nr:UPF0481 protein At3g47200-like [Mangifera indica]XP_044481619.1 UPF0481 protein At3g47200-like [Mangifera indica]XP_044481620.1 UPF0481 protein At3g47200-like [Mangifera indica]XP_044481621.1 UPF0481 protein At3g47200-like [Mangifera indica]XP_044481622.1 UPF0481 protein At3g47200-like [Mangifera indica]XP_044481623.1 UPF0481 protein At3g47200-like [Mangifera indica]XP_044481624.1 UPF0481 protein At3g47200-like [Mangifera indica]XP_044481625.1 UPF0481 protein At3g47200-like [Mangifera ind
MTAAFENGDLVKELLIDINENVKPEPNPDRCCIFRVPKKIRSVKEELYTPELISIGPLHHDKPELADMEMKKKQFMKSFLQRTTTEKIDKIFSYIKDNEEQIRVCYSETSTLGSLEFVMMILYDCIFIMEIFLRKRFQDRSDIDTNPIRYSLWIDLQLFENQLPYFILEEIYKLAFVGIDLPTFMDLSIDFFGGFIGVKLSRITPELGVKHFTDWRRISLLKGYPNSALAKRVIYDLSCTVNLHESGIKFKGIIKKEQSLLDVKFEKRWQQIPFFEVYELQIPHLIIGDETEFLLRNIIALEQCIYPNNDLVCNYVELMDSLINSVKDVDLLVGNQIISNHMGDNVSVATMFNALGQNVITSTSPYHNLCKELQEHYNSPWNRAKATLKRVYFSNPWRGTGTVTAIILLLLAVTGTVCSILQVV